MNNYSAGFKTAMTSYVFTVIILFVFVSTPDASAPEGKIDLKGTVTTTSGKSIGQVIVTLAASGITDTTDESGAFHLFRDPMGISGRKIIHHMETSSYSPAPVYIEFFDIAGRLKKCLTIDSDVQLSLRQLLHHPDMATLAQSMMVVRVRNEGTYTLFAVPGHYGSTRYMNLPSSGKNTVAKKTAAADTLTLHRTGYLSRKIPVTVFEQDLGAIVLEAGTAPDTFDFRKPSELKITCESMSGSTEMSFWNVDLLCKCENDSLQATIYLQTRPESCGGPMSATNYAVEKAWIKTDNGIQLLQQALYDWGGNHHNDRVTFAWNGKFISFYHASFGFGWRACSRPDCMQICGDEACRTILYDGCARSSCSDRPALKVSCVQVQTDGTVPELLDPWTSHAGNDTYLLLPCPGDSYCK